MHGNQKRIVCLIIVVMMAFICTIPANASTPDLKNFLETEKLYKCVSIKNLNTQHRIDKDSLKNNYKDIGVVVSGIFKSNSLQSDKEFYLYSDSSEEYIIIDTSADKGIANSYKDNDTVIVYGTLESIKTDSYKLKATHVEVNSKEIITEGAYVYYGKASIFMTSNLSLAADRHIEVCIPDSWNSRFVKDSLPNHKIQGNQYYLNALSPINKEYAEIFYIFYLPYNEFVSGKVDRWNVSDVDKLVVQNILTEEDGEEANIKYKEKSVKGIDDLYYYAIDKKLEDDKEIADDYTLEFFFKRDGKYTGVIVMLYLHYPNLEKANHLNEVAAVIKTLEN